MNLLRYDRIVRGSSLPTEKVLGAIRAEGTIVVHNARLAVSRSEYFGSHGRQVDEISISSVSYLGLSDGVDSGWNAP